MSVGIVQYLFNQLEHLQKGSLKCSGDGRTCSGSIYKEEFFYTGKMHVEWRPIEWDDPTLSKILSVDVMNLIPHIAAKVPGFEAKIEVAQQQGEIFHQARVERQYYDVLIVDQKETARKPTFYEKTNSTRWVPAPGGRDLVQRNQMQICVGPLCGEVK